MPLKLSILLILLLTNNVHGDVPSPKNNEKLVKDTVLSLNHSLWDKLLKKHVDDSGNVD
jgi:hypothetical protein